MTTPLRIVDADDAGAERPVTAMLEALVEATPAPPEGEPDGLLAAFDVMVAHRAEVLARLAAASPPGLDAGGQALLDELHRRDQAWLAALARAQGVVSDRLVAVRRAQRMHR
ncbi:MAG TPA: hypothetical protein VHE35_22850 [Kofleriaceae bacterium]|nr:hypothetical protein [Kofleriaceae bacterium]